MKYDAEFLKIVNDFSQNENVEGIMLAGSRATGFFDKDSDYDLYIYSFQEIPLELRQKIAEKFFHYYELDNRTWELEDVGLFKESEIQIDIIFRNLNWTHESLKNVVAKHQASTGYTTCLWGNFISSKILFDRNGILENMNSEYNVQYPLELQQNIMSKNLPLLNQIIPAYTHQIEKALKRDDLLSINHRLSAFFESYFDILFAVNKIPHPGEKRMLQIALKNCKILPENMEKDIEYILQHMYSDNDNIPKLLCQLVKKLKKIL
ncbi:MAG: DUF4037 domain-containing protein [Candidatus Marinimicrobia bacterium]|nr:DUF4037 domain-containing protein [Candidatus Neomarinimicrobiota bacterium]